MNRVPSRRQMPIYEVREQRFRDADALEYCPECGTSHPVSRVNGDYVGECPQQWHALSTPVLAVFVEYELTVPDISTRGPDVWFVVATGQAGVSVGSPGFEKGSGSIG